MVVAPMVSIPIVVALDPVRMDLAMAPSILVPLLVLILSSNGLYTLENPVVLLIVVVVPLLPMPHHLPCLPHPMPTLLPVTLLVL